MAFNLKKFNTEADYSAATLSYPAVSWVTGTDTVHFDKTEPTPPTPTFSGLTIYYNISDISQPTELFNAGGGGAGSGSGSGSGGVLPSAMLIDGTAVEVTNTYQFSTTGEHIVQYSFEDNQIPNDFLSDGYDTGKFSTVTKVEIGDALTSIGNSAFYNCTGLTSVTIHDSVTSIDANAFTNCYSLTSLTIGSGVTSISNAAFNSCRDLTSVIIPSSVTSIGSNAFSFCTSLTSITSLATTAPTISNNTFGSVNSGGTLTVPSGSSGYDVWMQNANYYLGLYGWTKVEQ